MRVVRVGTVFLLFGLCALAAPKIRVEPASLDFGTVRAGTKAEQDVTVYNDGDAPLIVLRAKASCGCTRIEVPEGEHASIEPGASVRMPVRFDATGRTAKQSNVVTVTTNDPDRPAVTIPVNALVETLTLLRPPNGLLWQQASRGEEIRRTVVIAPGDAVADIELIDITSDAAVLTPAATKVTRNGQQMIDVKFTLAKDAPLGELSATVTARVRVAGEETTVTIPASGLVVGDVFVSPLEIKPRHGPIARGDSVGEILVRASRGGTAPLIAGLETAGPVRAEIEPVRGEDLRKVVVTAAPDAPTGPCSATVYIMTSAADQPAVSVPVYFEVARNVAVQPETVVLDAAHTKQRIELRTVTGKPLTVKSIVTGSKIVNASIVAATQESGNKLAVVEIALPGTTIESLRGTLVTIETDLPGEGAVRVPVLVRP